VYYVRYEDGTVIKINRLAAYIKRSIPPSRDIDRFMLLDEFIIEIRTISLFLKLSHLPNKHNGKYIYLAIYKDCAIILSMGLVRIL
jgi:hypothetical protein